ncbi:MAG: GDP-mannose 4,6-dehydratase [Nitrospinota bacterium]|jgi:UDP-glucose 4-epimerase|nr:GDP-mannose 4,6-dehydratase [Nitrospinota bacterium]|tara:strand:- start:5203 stop:6171 length:969 start_codon:yes stop_codon:yes gene_type:complete
MKKTLVTGVAGMIGSHLTDSLLEKGYSIVGVDDLSVGKIENIEHQLRNKNYSFEKLDILDIQELKKVSRNVDTIVHLAATKKIGEDGSGYNTLTVNTKGTENVLEIAKKNNCKTVIASTSDVYGMSPDLPLKEDGDLLLGPSMIKRWSYAVSKLYCEQLAFAYNKDFNVPIVVLRYFGGFSPRSSFSWSGGHIPLFVDAILKNEELIVHGDGKQTRSMGYVSDLVDGTILAMENPSAIGQIINIGNDEEMSVIGTAYLIDKIANTGNELKIKFVPFENVFGEYKDIMRRVPDLRKAKKLLGYEPQISLREAIKITIEHRTIY